MLSAHQRFIPLQAIPLFVYGGAVHIILLRLYLNGAYPRGAKPQFVDALSTYAIAAIFGGIIVTLLFLLLLERTRSVAPLHSLRLLMLAGLFGIAGTVLTAAACTLVGALLLAIHLNSTAGPLLFMLSSLEIGTYALGPAIVSVPYAFTYGVIIGVYLLILRRTNPIRPQPQIGLVNGARLSLGFGVLGLLFVFIPFVGAVLSGLALLYGIRAMRSKEATSRHLPSAKIGAALGALCIAFWLFSFVVYLAARFGWVGGS
jgi:hypothetical protein